MKRIYLDYAAATPVNPRVFQAMVPFFSDNFYNPSALYLGAREAKTALEESRSKVAQLIGARPSEIIFTAGGTESTNLAIHGVMQSFPGGEILTSAVEHDAVLHPASRYNHTTIQVDAFGRVDMNTLKSLITDNTVMVSVMLANNEIGTIQSIKDIAQVVDSVRADRRQAKNKMPLYLHTDACQAPLYLDVHVAKLGVDLMTLNGGKMYGPKQSGILYVKAGVILTSQISGGGQEWGYRSGTENVAFAAGFARALELADRGRSERSKNMIELREYFMKQLEIRFQGAITGHRTHRLANNIHVIFPDIDNERVLFALDDAGIDAAAGSACSASNDTPSHVLLAIGKSEIEARQSLRFSLGSSSNRDSIDKTLTILEHALKA